MSGDKPLSKRQSRGLVPASWMHCAVRVPYEAEQRLFDKGNLRQE